MSPFPSLVPFLLPNSYGLLNTLIAEILHIVGSQVIGL
jgi:hypothetical protein